MIIIDIIESPLEHYSHSHTYHLRLDYKYVCMRLRNGKFVGKLMIDVGVNSKDIREKDKLFDISRVITPRKTANKKI